MKLSSRIFGIVLVIVILGSMSVFAATEYWGNFSDYSAGLYSASPNAQFKSPSRSIQINAAGETFGSSAYAESLEDEPDLVLAEGVGGMVGYVKSSDLNSGAAKSPEEAAKSTIDKNTRFIPLYESDGKTVIGRFKIAPDTERIITIVD
ncbi:hypothetical protein [Acidaminobacter sp.]|uniref:hypothetical protein n=1 Tax=Acidaminobacter sp. TaxID=1872102 RepID=UPI00137DDA47|nr:hypothetical protein [Acidaminobacter sp.]MDK9711400.1 hypothetical protein [Acidaminobacter sp.]MZQ97071.1 hypothetical protein [Acidaminobacter sp.]